MAGESRKNAFTELMTAKPAESKTSSNLLNGRTMRAPIERHGMDPSRKGLGVYIANPKSHHAVIYHNENFVAIRDLYPKATVHFLLLPRDESRFFLHPFDALADPAFLLSVRMEADRLRGIAASELRRQIGRQSAQEKRRNEMLDRSIDGANGTDAATPASCDDEPESLPPGRDYSSEIMVGIHSGPSMDHLHIHVLSRDMHSDCVKHRRHYNSFNTPFFVELDEFPIDVKALTRSRDWRNWAETDLICWRCKKSFGNRFAELKRHLDIEYAGWAAE